MSRKLILGCLLLIATTASAQLRVATGLIGQYTPSLVSDFTLGPTPAGYTFTRNSPVSTRVNASGLIETVAANVPRIDHDPVTLACRGLLIEESRTNLLKYSADYTNAVWAKNGAAVATGIVAPDGSTSTKLLDNTSNTTHFLAQDPGTLTDNTTYTLSVYARAAEYISLTLQGTLKDGSAPGANFNLSTQIVSGISTGVTTSIINAGNGWYRCSITYSVSSGTANTTGRCRIYALNSSGQATYTGTGTSGIYIWGSQFEPGAFATSYIPATSATVTRAADDCRMTSIPWHNATEGTIYAEAIATNANNPATAGNTILDLNNNTSSQRFQLRLGTSTGIIITTAGAVQTAILNALAMTNNVRKMAVSYRRDDINAVLDGGTVANDNTSLLPAPIQLRIGAYSAGGEYLNGWVRRITYYPRRLPNPFLQSLTQ